MSGVEEVALAGALAPELLGAVGTAAAGTAAAGTGAALGAGAAGAGLMGAEAAGAGMLAAPEAGALLYTTPSIFSGAAPLSGTLAGTALDYGTPAMLSEANAAATAAEPGMLAQMGGYASKAGKAASAYNAVNGAMGGGAQPQRPPPQARPVFQGEAPPIAQGQMQPQENQFARMLMEQRMRAQGMLG